MLEAAAKDCAVLIHHNNPYKVLATDKNSFDLNKKTFFDWQKYLLLNPNDVHDRKEQLKQDVKRYDIKALSEKRHDIYQQYKILKA
jgi:myo-inositol-hexaphosphate 3-phosphohydrolase